MEQKRCETCQYYRDTPGRPLFCDGFCFVHKSKPTMVRKFTKCKFWVQGEKQIGRAHV